jgi:hypothetical protein
MIWFDFIFVTLKNIIFTIIPNSIKLKGLENEIKIYYFMPNVMRNHKSAIFEQSIGLSHPISWVNAYELPSIKQ